MSIFHKAYSLFSYPVGLTIDLWAAIFKKNATPKGMWLERRGIYDEGVKALSPYDLWIHGVSVGEVGVIKAILDRLEKKDAFKVLVSSFTEQGYLFAKKAFKGEYNVIFYPLDYKISVKRAVTTIRPRCYACIETEIWPNLINELSRQGTRLLILNGRISEESFNSYKKVRPLMADTLRLFEKIFVISDTDRKRFLTLGARKERVFVSGNAKYERLIDLPEKFKKGTLERAVQKKGSFPKIVAGSIRKDEYKIIISAFLELKREFKDAFLILVPRHLERVREISEFLKRKKISFKKVSELREISFDLEGLDCILVDQIGLLYGLYAICDFSFVGGSLVNRGGQNLMEPASWGKPVIFGPNYKNFLDAGDALLRDGGGMVIRNKDELFNAFLRFSEDETFRKRTGENARRSLLRLGKGAATIQARGLFEALG